MTDGPFLISTMPPGRRQRAVAHVLAVCLAVAFLGAFAFREVQLTRYDAFVPIANTIICLNDVITAALLYVQYSMTRQRALLALASGFLFKALTMIPHALTFPGAFAPHGLLGAHLQTTALLYMTQHLVFLVGAVVYTIYRDVPDETTLADRPPARTIWVAACAVIAGVAAATWLSTRGATALPTFMADATNTTTGFRRSGSRLLLLEVAASVVVFRRRATSVIDLWLKVAMWAWVFETLMTIVVESRFSLVFYVSRSLGVASSSFVLLVFFSESMMLHRRLVATLVAREQEREGHRTTIDIVLGTLAHEIRQPLMAILVNEQVGRKLHSMGPRGGEQLPEVLDDIRSSVARANEVIDSVRTMFAPTAGDRGAVDPNALVRDAAELTRLELEAHRVTLVLDLAPDLPEITGHRGQLIEVMLNGLKNAIESLAEVSDRERALLVRTRPVDGHRVAVSIEDSGAGLDPRARARAFDPFFTTKPHGMGLGLSICRSIVAAHGGALSLEPRTPHGTVFRVELVATPAAERGVRAGESAGLGASTSPGHQLTNGRRH